MTTPARRPLCWIALGALMLTCLGVMPTAANAGYREVRVDLRRYCRSLRLDYAGYSRRRKAFTCAVLTTGFNTYYYTHFRSINLSAVCRKYHHTDKWRFQGERVWCLVPTGADLRLCNRLGEDIWSAIAYYVNARGRRARERGWVTQGWWKLGPGQCDSIWTNVDYAGDIYVHAETASQDLAGADVRLCVGTGSPFKLSESDRIDCRHQGVKLVGMQRFRLHSGHNTWNFR